VIAKVLSAFEAEWDTRYQKAIVFQSVFQCENGLQQQAFLLREFPDTQHLFGDMAESGPWQLPRVSSSADGVNGSLVAASAASAQGLRCRPG
jgi:hypothetical protein